jgi:NAD(P)-dependent dehydrogenase (short-subunit alcohol dehydrogenase family)
MTFELLKGEFGIVTGAAQGLGEAIAKAYVSAGMRVALVDVQADRLARVVKTFNADGGDCIGISADLSDAYHTESAVQEAILRYGTPRVLVHNAAILNVLPFAEVSFAEWQRVLNVSLQAAYLLTHAVWPLMTHAGKGSIVYVSSRSGIVGFDGESAYCASKHALEGLMKTLAMEGKALNIAVNTVTPGAPMHTPMSERNYTDDLKQQWIDPIQLTPAFLKLAETDASGISGQRLSAWALSQE